MADRGRNLHARYTARYRNASKDFFPFYLPWPWCSTAVQSIDGEQLLEHWPKTVANEMPASPASSCRLPVPTPNACQFAKREFAVPPNGSAAAASGASEVKSC